MNEFRIEPEDPRSVSSAALIAELEAELDPLYPAKSRHGYSVDKLIREEVAFFVVRVGKEAAGCGGIQLYGREYGELKRMYLRPSFRGQGLARALLDHLATYAQDREVRLLRLETGIHQLAAIHLYERYGFVRREPFGNYREDPLSVFMETRI